LKGIVTQIDSLLLTVTRSFPLEILACGGRSGQSAGLSKVAVNVLLEVGSLVNVGELVAVDVGTSVEDSSMTGVDVSPALRIGSGEDEGKSLATGGVVATGLVGAMLGTVVIGTSNTAIAANNATTPAIFAKVSKVVPSIHFRLVAIKSNMAIPKRKTAISAPMLLFSRLHSIVNVKDFNSLTDLLQVTYSIVAAAQRHALAAWGGRVDLPPKREKIKVAKNAEKRGAYPKSAARIVGCGMYCPSNSIRLLQNVVLYAT
jgi:hypothetical protein